MRKILNDEGERVEISEQAFAAMFPPVQTAAVLAPLTPRRFWLAALSLGITEDMVDARIDALPEPQRSAYRIEKRHAQSYERVHPLVQSLPQAFGITEVALDAAWASAPA